MSGSVQGSGSQSIKYYSSTNLYINPSIPYQSSTQQPVDVVLNIEALHRHVKDVCDYSQSTLKRKLDDLDEDEKEKYRDQKSKIRKYRETLVPVVNDCTEAITADLDSLKKEREKNLTLDQSITMLKQQMEYLMSSNEDLKKHVATLQTSNEDLKKQVATLQTSNEDIKNSNEDLKKQVATLQTSNEDLKKQVATLQTSNEDMKKQVATLQTTYELVKSLTILLAVRMFLPYENRDKEKVHQMLKAFCTKEKSTFIRDEFSNIDKVKKFAAMFHLDFDFGEDKPAAQKKEEVYENFLELLLRMTTSDSDDREIFKKVFGLGGASVESNSNEGRD